MKFALTRVYCNFLSSSDSTPVRISTRVVRVRIYSRTNARIVQRGNASLERTTSQLAPQRVRAQVLYVCRGKSALEYYIPSSSSILFLFWFTLAEGRRTCKAGSTMNTCARLAAQFAGKQGETHALFSQETEAIHASLRRIFIRSVV